MLRHHLVSPFPSSVALVWYSTPRLPHCRAPLDLLTVHTQPNSLSHRRLCLFPTTHNLLHNVLVSLMPSDIAARNPHTHIWSCAQRVQLLEEAASWKLLKRIGCMFQRNPRCHNQPFLTSAPEASSPACDAIRTTERTRDEPLRTRQGEFHSTRISAASVTH